MAPAGHTLTNGSNEASAPSDAVVTGADDPSSDFALLYWLVDLTKTRRCRWTWLLLLPKNNKDAVSWAASRLNDAVALVDREAINAKRKNVRTQKNSTLSPELARELQPMVATTLMSVLFAGRWCRHDMLRQVNMLASNVTKWDKLDDKRFFQIASYINFSFPKRLVGYIGGSKFDVACHIYADADRAGCTATQRSTSGVFHCIASPNSCLQLFSQSQKQTATSCSTLESENGGRPSGCQECL